MISIKLKTLTYSQVSHVRMKPKGGEGKKNKKTTTK